MRNREIHLNFFNLCNLFFFGNRNWFNFTFVKCLIYFFSAWVFISWYIIHLHLSANLVIYPICHRSIWWVASWRRLSSQRAQGKSRRKAVNLSCATKTFSRCFLVFLFPLAKVFFLSISLLKIIWFIYLWWFFSQFFSFKIFFSKLTIFSQLSREKSR